MAKNDYTKLFNNKRLSKLIKGIAKRKTNAFREFYDLYGRAVYVIAKSICLTKENAEEVLNDVMVKVWNKAPSLVENNPGGWLYRIIVNASIDKYRSYTARAEKNCAIEYDVAATADDYERVHGEMDFAYYLSDLNESESEILILKFVYDLTFADIAKTLGLPVGTVTAKYYGALKKIKEKKFGKNKKED